MQYIDNKFKDACPTDTVCKIQELLNGLNIETVEKWHDSGLDNCWSLTVSAKGGFPIANGKGVSKEFARASAYGEFIERLQGGLFFYKFQEIGRDSDMNLQSFAPDIKYVTAKELEEDGDWMDYLIKSYGNGLTRKAIVKFCKLYACTDEDKIATVPFYSLFEDKYVYLPIGFVDQIYATNGCCAGNNREEAWVHALSEMMERHASLKMLTSGEAAPKISEEILQQFPTVMNIIKQIRESGKFDVDVFDYSLGNGFPVVSTRIINKENQTYRVNVAADPVLEIAVQRTLTETFQGKNINKFSALHGGRILTKLNDFSKVSNVINQLETSSGVYVADFFANELTCDREASNFEDRTDMTNKELLQYMLSLYKQLEYPVYVRNFSYLGFPSYRFVVPGFSEAVAVKFEDIFPDALAAECSKFLKNITEASQDELSMVLMHGNMLSTVYSRYHNFGRMAGLPLVGEANTILFPITRSYAAYKTKSYNDAIFHLEQLLGITDVDEKIRKYFSCVKKYIFLRKNGVKKEKVRVILYKFFEEEYVRELYEKVDAGLSPYDGYLLNCDYSNCTNCSYRSSCLYNSCKEINVRVGQEYNKFTNGQSREQFML